jgi:adenylate kinase
MKRLIFIGPAGVGKGTQAGILSSDWKIPHISMHALLQRAIEDEAPLGKLSKIYLQRGDLIPDQLKIKLIEERLLKSDAKRGWILIGFPWNTLQAIHLKAMLREIDQPVDQVVHFEVSNSFLIDRLKVGSKVFSIQHKLSCYQQPSPPLIDFYKEHRCLMTINANLPVSAITHLLKVSLREPVSA